MKVEYILSSVLLVLIAVGVGFLFVSPSPEKINTSLIQDKNSNSYIEIVNPSGFVNTDDIALKDLIGKKVILVDFLTYSCINCQRTFPYLNVWYEKYKDQGLEIVGIHTPEFAFEKDIHNVREAMKKFGIKYPIVLDNDYSTWNAYGNRYWPRKYLIDINGNIVYDHIGEGAYEETEMKIKELLEERAKVLGEGINLDKSLASADVSPKEILSGSPETYFGSSRNEYLANGQKGLSGEQNFFLPRILIKNGLYLSGNWNIFPEYAQSISDSSVFYKYEAKEVYIVAESLGGGEVEIYQDGKLVSDQKGEDVSVDGKVNIKESRLYKLILNPVSSEYTLEIKVTKGKIRFFAFTFG